MKKSLLIGFIGSALGLGACGGGGGGKASPEDLAKAVVDALAKKDKAAFTAMYVTPDGIVSACKALEPKVAGMKEKFAKGLEKAGANFDECAKLGDWSKAQNVKIEGGKLKDAEKECPDFREVRDVEVTAELDGKKVQLQLDDPLSLGGKVFLADRFECRAASAADTGADRLVAEAKPEADKPVAAPAPAAPAAPADPAAPAAPAADAPVAAAGSTGSAECDKFIVSYEACLAKMPESVRGSAEGSLKQMKEMFAKIPDKSMLESTCKQSYDSMKQAIGQLCPDAFK